MRPFGNPKLRESEAVARFVGDTTRLVNEQWEWALTELSRAIPKTLARRPNLLDLGTTRMVFVLATQAIGLQAVRQLFPKKRAQLIVDCTMAAVEAAYSDENAALLLAEFDREWNTSLGAQRNPMDALGAVMFNLLRLEDTVEEGGKSVMSPTAVASLSSVPARLARGGPKGSGQAWWTICCDEFNILP